MFAPVTTASFIFSLSAKDETVKKTIRTKTDKGLLDLINSEASVSDLR